MDDKKIRVLNEDVIGKISAGEVVERPASVIKELVENSIDAGAGSVDIDVEAAGQTLIRIADNGSGMCPEDAKTACLRHATSKICDISDLDRLNTFGFRGEALASIAAVSRMEMITSSGHDGAGVCLELESGVIRRTRPAGRDRGTTIEVRNLFYNVPARKKFLKKEATELAEIVNVAGRFIVSYPEVEFKLNHGGRTLLHATSGMGTSERIRLVLGGDVADQMIAVSLTAGKHAITGFVSRPSMTQKDRSTQLFFVNRRYVRSRMLGDALDTAYRSLLERGRYPAAVLFVDIPPSEVDVNVHPTKLLVKFDDEKVVRTAIVEAVSCKFNDLKGVMASEASVRGCASDPSNVVLASTDAQMTEAPEVQAQFSYEIKNSAFPRTKAESYWPQAKMSLSGRGSCDVFQVGGCFIVRLSSDGIEITDQHAAHERVFYEYFAKTTGGTVPEVQNLLFPVRIDLSAGEAVIMSKVTDVLKSLGFHVDFFGDRSYLVQAVPAVLKDRDIKTVILDALADLGEKDLGKIDIIDEMVKIMSCRAAVKAGDKLTTEEMTSILDSLYRCELPFTCPHGRPTVIELKVPELEKMFRRK